MRPRQAALSVAASVYAVSLLVVRLNRVLSLLPASVLGLLNLLVWMANSELWIRGDALAFQAGLFTATSAIALYLLFRWHARFSKAMTGSSGSATS